MLWLPVSSDAKFKGKPTIDTLFARLGDGMAALTVAIGVNVLALSTQYYFAFTALLERFKELALVPHGQKRAPNPYLRGYSRMELTGHLRGLPR